MKEIFKDIPWYEWLYQISNLWDIKSLLYRRGSNSRILNPSPNSLWYMHINLSKDKNIKIFKVHRLVLLTFKWYNKLDVNHKNWIKSDNKLSNLEYVTKSENTKHMYKVLWYKWPRNKNR